jgi:hypothetical protein
VKDTWSSLKISQSISNFSWFFRSFVNVWTCFLSVNRLVNNKAIKITKNGLKNEILKKSLTLCDVLCYIWNIDFNCYYYKRNMALVSLVLNLWFVIGCVNYTTVKLSDNWNCFDRSHVLFFSAMVRTDCSFCFYSLHFSLRGAH